MFLPSHTRVYLALDHTDMRKTINGLSILVEDQLHQDPFSGHLFVFCNRRRHNSQEYRSHREPQVYTLSYDREKLTGYSKLPLATQRIHEGLKEE